MSSQRDGGVDDATQAAPEGEGEGNEGVKSSFSEQLLSDARDMGHIIGEPKRSEEGSSATEETTDEGEEVTEDETPEEIAAEGDQGDTTDEEIEEEDEAKKEAESESSEVSGDQTKIEKQIEDLESQGKKVPWYLSRIAKDTRLKNERTKERDEAARVAIAWKERAENAEAQLSEGSGPRPTTSDPLANIFNFQKLEEKKNDAEKWVAWSERNRNGGEAVVGQDKDGKDITEYLDEEQVTNLKLGCEKVLREGIPNRRAYLADFQKANTKAAEIYQEYQDSNSPFYREATEILSALQQGFLPPDVMIWIGHAIKARNDYVATLNGSGKTSNVTKKIVTSAKTKVAPTPTKQRGFTPRVKGADLETARKNLQTKGDSQSAEQLLERLGIGGRGRSKREPVEA